MLTSGLRAREGRIEVTAEIGRSIGRGAGRRQPRTSPREIRGDQLGCRFLRLDHGRRHRCPHTALLSAAGAAIGLTELTDQAGDAETVGIVGAALLVAVALIAYFAGGYVAGRMSRFDGARQGIAT